MDNGLIQILVIAFFIIISMMDGVARKKRQEQRGGPELGRSEEDVRGNSLFSTTREPMSEGMVPDELWEEIAALARGEPTPSTQALLPSQLPEVELRSMPTDAAEPEETRLGPAHQHVERHDHVEWAPDDSPPYPVVPAADEMQPAHTIGEFPTISTPPPPTRATGRALSGRTEVPYVAASSDEPGKFRRPVETRASVRRTLIDGGHASIRQAVILSEVLGPPVALRDRDHEPPG